MSHQHPTHSVTEPTPTRQRTIVCPLCSFSFTRDEMRCHSGCPLAKYCDMVCCPSCNYQFVAERNFRSRVGKLWLKLRRKRDDSSKVCALAELAPNCPAEVVAIDLQRNPRLARLSVFGLTRGSRIEVRQRWPEYVVRIGETDLAIESAIAEAIHVRPLVK